MEFELIIEETVSKHIKIDADSAEDAIRKAAADYENGKNILEPGDLESCQIALIDKEKQISSDWIRII